MGISFWRSFTHWIGGMGVLVFVMMITSLDDENAMPLMRTEVPGHRRRISLSQRQDIPQDFYMECILF